MQPLPCIRRKGLLVSRPLLNWIEAQGWKPLLQFPILEAAGEDALGVVVADAGGDLQVVSTVVGAPLVIATNVVRTLVRDTQTALTAQRAALHLLGSTPEDDGDVHAHAAATVATVATVALESALRRVGDRNADAALQRVRELEHEIRQALDHVESPIVRHVLRRALGTQLQSEDEAWVDLGAPANWPEPAATALSWHAAAWMQQHQALRDALEQVIRGEPCGDTLRAGLGLPLEHPRAPRTVHSELGITPEHAREARLAHGDGMDIASDQYPSDQDLAHLRALPAVTDEQRRAALQRMVELWNTTFGRCELVDATTGSYRFVTGGWSGNEDLLEALPRIVHAACWQYSSRGGVHCFIVDRCAKPQTTAASVTCPRCGLTSYNLHDVREQFCARCCVFWGEHAGPMTLPRALAAQAAALRGEHISEESEEP